MAEFSQRIAKLKAKALALAEYCWTGVWKDPRRSFGIGLIKTLNLSARSFMDRGLQTKSMSLTYSTVLAIVPAFALLFAIGRGFGFQNLLEDQLYSSFPSQRQAIATALSFVDSYLSQASQGIFVGIGLVMLLWTLISLLSTIEDAFNSIWDIRKTRSMYQKITDYIAICLVIPVLMVCSSGVSIFMGTIAQNNVQLRFLTPVINVLLELSPLFLSWLAFSLSFFLIPNTKVNFKYAAVSGGVCAIVFTVLQLLFVNGQIYVAKYNAIYGSFAFLPLMLIWLQLSWLVLLFGCVLTYSLQNVFTFNFLGDVSGVSAAYGRKITLVVATAIVKGFEAERRPMTRTEISASYDLPIRIVGRTCDKLHKAGLIYFVMLPKDRIGLTPAIETDRLTVGELFRRVDSTGESDFIPRFSTIYHDMFAEFDSLMEETYSREYALLVRDVNLPSRATIARILAMESERK